jgi:hypothetical protein
MNGKKSEEVRGRSGREKMATRLIDPQLKWHWGNEREGKDKEGEWDGDKRRSLTICSNFITNESEDLSMPMPILSISINFHNY